MKRRRKKLMVIIPVAAVCVAGAGTVDSVSGKECMVTLTDNGTTYGDTVTVTDSSGKELGSGELVIHEPLEITGISGTVSAVNVLENASVSEGTALLTLEGSANETQYQKLLAKREARTATLKKLIQLKADPEIKAEISGTVQSVNISAGSENRENVITIPVNALQERGEKIFVYTEKDDEGNLSGETEVTTGLSDGSTVEITEGLSEGDTVYYNKTGNTDSGNSSDSGMPGEMDGMNGGPGGNSDSGNGGGPGGNGGPGGGGNSGGGGTPPNM